MSGRRAYRWAIFALLLLAMGLRFTHLSSQSFWNDEGNSARLSERSVRLIIEGTASDIHPPFYYLLLSGWRRMGGASEYSLRAVSAFAGVLVVALTVRLVADLGRDLKWRRATVLLSGLFVAVSAPLVYYSQETRMYSLLAAEALATTLLLFQFLRRPAWATAIGYVLLSAAGLYTHYFYPIVLLLHGLLALPSFLMSREPLKQEGRRLLPLFLVPILLYAPWLPIFWRSRAGRVAVRPSPLTFWPQKAHFMLFGHTLQTLASEIYWLVGAVALVFSVYLVVKRSRLFGLALLFWLPPVAVWALGVSDVAFDKFLLMAVPGLWLLISVALLWLPRRLHLLGGGMALVTVAGLLYFNALSLGNVWAADGAYARADYRGIAREISAAGHPSAAVILDAPNQWEVFTYYHRQGAIVYPLPASGADRAATEAELVQILAQHERVYVLFWGEGQQDPERVVERWLDVNAFKSNSEWVGDVRVVQYERPTINNDAPQSQNGQSLQLPFGEVIILSEFRIANNQLRPNDTIQVTLYWQAQQIVEERYKVFVHLLDAEGTIVAQWDSEPQGGGLPTNQWTVGELIEDRYGVPIPADLSAGRYMLSVGMYDVADPARRLPIQSITGVVDRYILTEIAILSAP